MPSTTVSPGRKGGRSPVSVAPLSDSVVSSLASATTDHPFVALGLSPCREHAVAARKDTLLILDVLPSGLTLRKSIGIAPFLESASNLHLPNEQKTTLNLRTFAYGGGNSSTKRGGQGAANFMANVTSITDVAWGNGNLIAVAGSNGSILVWTAAALLDDTISPRNVTTISPEAIFPHLHLRAINRLSWHPVLSNILLSASQDTNIMLWEPVAVEKSVSTPQNRFSFGFAAINAKNRQFLRWQSRATFKPKGDGVRDVRWSPHHPDVFAVVTTTGTLVVYNRYITARAIAKIVAHSGMATAVDWHPTRPNILATGGAGDRSVKVWTIDFDNIDETDPNTATLSSKGDRTSQLASPIKMVHNLSIASPVNRLRWRPPSNDSFSLLEEDRHDSMLAVATAPIQGGAYGGSGVLSLWSYHRPFMALSVVDGHLDGGITDFDWLDTPSSVSDPMPKRNRDSSEMTSRVPGSSQHENDSIVYDNSEKYETDRYWGIWQHVISLGRDGRCLLQSFVRGDRPISRVPPTCFAIENLSPFQQGYGSLQIFSVYQDVPSSPSDDYLLTGLRRDGATKSAPGIFEEDSVEVTAMSRPFGGDMGRRIPENPPDISFFVVDQGDLDDCENPAGDHDSILVAPEVLHLSRFADRYCLYISERHPTRSSLCFHNASVADDLRQHALGQMWRSLGFLLHQVGEDYSVSDKPESVHQYVLIPTVVALLDERANAGDVQSCIAICEILRVVTGDATLRLAGVSLDLVREWYLSYIDLLHGMSLFTQAVDLMKHCEDPFINGLNQQSTTIYESCPHCGKPLPIASDVGGRRACGSCRKGVGMCFVCHMPIRGDGGGTLFVWCPGCGHGGHLEHALEWFGGVDGDLSDANEVCPTGCGHRCNLFKSLKAFPRTESLKCLDCGIE